MPRKWVPVQKEFSAEVISRGRVTIPLTIRRLLNIKDGSIVTVTVSVPNGPQHLEVVADAQ